MYLLWNRFKYVLSPQFDIYEQISSIVRDRTADIGFGTGFGAHLLVEKAKEVYAYDIDEDAIRFARRVFPYKNLYFEHGDITKGISGPVFDCVVMIDVIEHIKHPRIALQNVKNMMANGATFICATPNRLSRYRKAETHYREYAPKELEGVLKRMFLSVDIRNYRLEPLASQYENPLVAICKGDKG